MQLDIMTFIMRCSLVLCVTASLFWHTGCRSNGQQKLGQTIDGWSGSHGLSVTDSGTLLLNGSPYRGVGVNYFNAFLRTLRDPQESDTSYRNGFRYLKDREIPFVRYAAGGFWPNEWKLYVEDPGTYFRLMDRFVADAESYGIGLIPALFWQNSTLPDLVGEPISAWGDPNSETTALALRYTREMVLRYRESPAIWAWEQGNEFNLFTDIPGDDLNYYLVNEKAGTPAVRTVADRLTQDDLHVAMTLFANEVRRYDPYRTIISGNGNTRPEAYHLYHEARWHKDSPEQYAEMLAAQNPDPMDMLSIHHYPVWEGQYFPESPASLKELVRATMEVSKRLRKPLFIGEFGAQELLLGVDTARAKYQEFIEAIEAYGVELAAMWVFDYPPHDREEGINVSPDNGPREYMLEAIVALNQRLAKGDTP